MNELTITSDDEDEDVLSEEEQINVDDLYSEYEDDDSNYDLDDNSFYNFLGYAWN